MKNRKKVLAALMAGVMTLSMEHSSIRSRRRIRSKSNKHRCEIKGQ